MRTKSTLGVGIVAFHAKKAGKTKVEVTLLQGFPIPKIQTTLQLIFSQIMYGMTLPAVAVLFAIVQIGKGNIKRTFVRNYREKIND